MKKRKVIIFFIVCGITVSGFFFFRAEPVQNIIAEKKEDLRDKSNDEYFVHYVTTVEDGEREVRVPNLDKSLPRDRDGELILTQENAARSALVFAKGVAWDDPDIDMETIDQIETAHVFDIYSECTDRHDKIARFEKDGEFAGDMLLRGKVNQEDMRWGGSMLTNVALREGVEMHTYDPAYSIPKTAEEARAFLPIEKQSLPLKGLLHICIDGEESMGPFYIFGEGVDRTLVSNDSPDFWTQAELEESWRSHDADSEEYQRWMDEEQAKDEASLPQRLTQAYQDLYSDNFEKREGALSIISEPSTLIDLAMSNDDPATRYTALERMTEIDIDSESSAFAETMELVLNDRKRSDDEREEALIYLEDIAEYAPEQARAIAQRLLKNATLTLDERSDLEELL